MRRTMIDIEDIGRGNTGGNKLLDSRQIKTNHDKTTT